MGEKRKRMRTLFLGLCVCQMLRRSQDATRMQGKATTQSEALTTETIG